MLTEVKTRKSFLKGTRTGKRNDCTSTQSSVIKIRGAVESQSEADARMHCLQYGKYFELKNKCLKCGLLISFAQGGK